MGRAYLLLLAGSHFLGFSGAGISEGHRRDGRRRDGQMNRPFRGDIPDSVCEKQLQSAAGLPVAGRAVDGI